MPDQAKEKELAQLQNHVSDLHREGKYSKALKAARVLLDDTTAHFGGNHPATATAHMNIGLMHKLLGQFNEGRREYLLAQQIYRLSLGIDHASYATVLHNLGNLNRSQIHFDADLRPNDRLALLDVALEYLEEAYYIRKAEMSREHPHTVASRSSWGAALASRILHQHKAESAAPLLHGRPNPVVVVASPSSPTLPSTVTETAWEAAEEHLRDALRVAIENPRGRQIADPHADKTINKQKQQQSRQKKKAAQEPQPVGEGGTEKQIRTLSAAAAAQNLAVFLKARAVITVEPHRTEWLGEAKALYTTAIAVQRELLHDGHPDLYASRYSLAELLEVQGNQAEADWIRQDIVDTYDETAPSDAAEDGGDEDDDDVNKDQNEDDGNDDSNDGDNDSKQDNEETIDKSAPASGAEAKVPT
jgi:tetratricopeptide (TPR) repeat protein